ncbi:hypothetical protein [Marinobacter sp. 2_MG-2023]|uniref:hypothetical protein n=1 Tax=Marinobacter sp. 2_MG-2023 TaxID=3062679 RepID=UPI0026E3D9EE|nr:hypothetical protein [Marinobacter sp. 2_MG-2023]MDO6444139.1 hypothetical protein [Marinobacter sp. 2_MG-2023]
MTHEDVIRQGKDDYFSQKGRYANPYPRGSEKFNAYERGWMQSLKSVKKPYPQVSGGSKSLADKYRSLPNWKGPGDSDD